MLKNRFQFELREYKNCAVRAFIAATDLESALRNMPPIDDNKEFKLLVMSMRDLSELLQQKLQKYIEQL